LYFRKKHIFFSSPLPPDLLLGPSSLLPNGYSAHKSPPLIQNLGQFNPVHPAHIPFIENAFLIVSSHLRPGLPSELFSSGLPAKFYFYMRDTCPAHLILLEVKCRNIKQIKTKITDINDLFVRYFIVVSTAEVIYC
jgi:hypothetical protein